jgi:hypothetical protein
VPTVADTTAPPAVDAVQLAQRVRATAEAAAIYLRADPVVDALVPVLDAYADEICPEWRPRAAALRVEKALDALDAHIAPRRAEYEAATAEHTRTMDLVTAVTRDEYGWPATGLAVARTAGALRVFLTPTPASLPSTYAADAIAAVLVEQFGDEVVGEDAHAAAVTLLDRVRTGDDKEVTS